MPAAVTTLWTDERIKATFNRHYVLNQLEPNERPLVDRSLPYGDGLTDDTYLDWILLRAKRLYLILTDIGVPDQIFGLVDENLDDNDLPIALENVHRLRLSRGPDKSLDRKFYKAQFRFLVKDIGRGEYVRYGSEETIPVESTGSKTGIPLLNKDDTDKVVLPSSATKVYTRKRITLNQEPSCLSEGDVLSEIALLTKYSHEHIVSIYASYSEGNNIYSLLTPAPEYTLKSFLNDPPKHFESLAKVDKRECLVNWPHCLASALAWLHSKGRHHGAIRPSNVLIDPEYRVFLGQFDAFNILHQNVKVDDIEAYQYAPPEKWKRSTTAQATGTSKTVGNSGGRSARKATAPKANPEQSWSDDTPGSEQGTIDTTKPTNTSVPFIPSSKSRIKLGDYRPGMNPAFGGHNQEASSGSSILSSDSVGTIKLSASALKAFGKKGWGSQQPPSRPTRAASVVSSTSSGTPDIASNAPIPDPIAVPSAEVRTAIVQTWSSADFDPFPSDIFTFGCIALDILSFLCKKKPSSFTSHRSSKNRTAGRGGGLADASFHANIGQLYSWCKTLDSEARKRLSKPDGAAFAAVKPMLEVVLKCIEKEPAGRLTAGVVEERLAECIWKIANFNQLHCTNLVDKMDQMSVIGPESPAMPTHPNHSRPRVESRQSTASGRSNGSGGRSASRMATIDEDGIARNQPIRSKLRLPNEPALASRPQRGRSVNPSSPFGYLGGGPTRSQTHPEDETWSQGDPDYYAQSYYTDEYEMGGDMEAPYPESELNSPRLGSQTSETAPSLHLNRISRFNIDLRQYSPGGNSPQTVDIDSPSNMSEADFYDESGEDKQQQAYLAPGRQVTTSSSGSSGITMRRINGKRAQNGGLDRESMPSLHPDDSISTRDLSHHGPSDGRASAMSNITSTSSNSSNPHFSWGWSNNQHVPRRTSNVSSAATTVSSRSAPRKQPGQSRATQGIPNELPPGSARISSRPSTSASGGRNGNWPLSIAEERGHESNSIMPYPVPNGHNSHRTRRHIAPIQQDSYFRAVDVHDHDYMDYDTEASETASSYIDLISPSSTSSVSAASSGPSPLKHDSNVRKGQQRPHHNPLPSRLQPPSPGTMANLNFSHPPPSPHAPPNHPVPPIPAQQQQPHPPSRPSSRSASRPRQDPHQSQAQLHQQSRPTVARQDSETLHNQQKPRNGNGDWSGNGNDHNTLKSIYDDYSSYEDEDEIHGVGAGVPRPARSSSQSASTSNPAFYSTAPPSSLSAADTSNGKWMKGEGGRYFWDDGRSTVNNATQASGSSAVGNAI